MGNYKDTLVAEIETWAITDEKARKEKFQRERIRHYGLVRDLLLDKLGTDDMDVLEVGGGPMPVSDLLRFRSRVVVDPLSDNYSRIIACPDHVNVQAEALDLPNRFDLAICTNALDHVELPEVVVNNITRSLRRGGYFAVCCAENNALTNPHPAHVHNLTADTIHRWCDADYETVWSLTYAEHGYRYGWASYDGRRGQPAFALLLRKCRGYN